MALILILILSLVPATLIYLWLKKRKDDEAYRTICSKAFVRGILWTVLLVILTSAILYIVERLFVVKLGVVITEVFHNFIVLAFAEELVKYLMFRGLIKKNSYSYSWLDITSLMMIIGIGFGLSESLAYAIGANAGMMIVRGLTAMHCGYGFIMGHFTGKAMKTNKKSYSVLAFILPLMLHGTYDFCLSEELAKISEYFAYVSLILAIAAIITLVIAIIHINKAKKSSVYTEPLVSE